MVFRRIHIPWNNCQISLKPATAEMSLRHFVCNMKVWREIVGGKLSPMPSPDFFQNCVVI